jgi:hypothetical protein
LSEELVVFDCAVVVVMFEVRGVGDTASSPSLDRVMGY